MGQAKKRMMEQDDRGFAFIDDKYVCANCFDEYGIQEFIQSNAEYFECDYCNSTSEDEPIAVQLGEVVAHIVHSIEMEYTDPVTELAYEKGYVGETIELSDLISYVEPIDATSEVLLKDILHSIHTEEWCLIGYYSGGEDAQLKSDWDDFSEQVRNSMRYVFFRAEYPLWRTYGRHEKPVDILDWLTNTFNELKLLKVLKNGTKIKRVRVSDKGERYSTVDKLGPPPYECATQSNRMSPAGIPMFYGADTYETARAETLDNRPTSNTIISCGTFELMRDIYILDLTTIPAVYSIYDEHYRHLRPHAKFMLQFRESLTKPIDREGREHIEYIPTQVLTEFVRYLVRTENQDKVMGIAYPSSQNRDGQSYVIFTDHLQCCQDGERGDNDLPPLLSLLTDTVKHERL